MNRPLFGHIATTPLGGPLPSVSLCGKPVRRFFPPGLRPRLVCGRCYSEFAAKSDKYVRLLDAILDVAEAAEGDAQ